MKLLVVLALLASAPASFAETVTPVSNFTPDLSAVRDFQRSGSYASQWRSPQAGGNLADHQGRGAGSFDDGGQGVVTFKVKAGSDGKAVVGFQDVGDTKNFKSFSLNGHDVTVPAPARNGGVFKVVLDFGKAGWHKVVAATTLKANRAGRQDGFSVCRR